MKNKIEAYWKKFLQETNQEVNLQYASAFAFGSDEAFANSLLELVLQEKKKATCSALEAFEKGNEPMPQIGDYSIVLNSAGEPKCIFKTTHLQKLKFKEMTYEICRREGEDDNLESWQNNHIDFFTKEGEKLGYQFSWDMEIIFEDFEVVYKK